MCWTWSQARASHYLTRTVVQRNNNNSSKLVRKRDKSKSPIRMWRRLKEPVNSKCNRVADVCDRSSATTATTRHRTTSEAATNVEREMTRRPPSVLHTLIAFKLLLFERLNDGHHCPPPSPWPFLLLLLFHLNTDYDFDWLVCFTPFLCLILFGLVWFFYHPNKKNAALFVVSVLFIFTTWFGLV